MSTVMGLPVIDPPEDGFTPLDGLAIVKGLDKDGNVTYAARATEGLTSIECLGMAHYAVLCLSAGWEDE